jgi:hypothetical protein
MSTYSAIHQVIGSGHPLDSRLRGYCRGLVPRVLRVTGYGPVIWIQSIPSSIKMAPEPHTMCQVQPHHSWLERRGTHPKASRLGSKPYHSRFGGLPGCRALAVTTKDPPGGTTTNTMCLQEEGSRTLNYNPFESRLWRSSPSACITGTVSPAAGKSPLTKVESFSYQLKHSRTRTFSTRAR